MLDEPKVLVYFWRLINVQTREWLSADAQQQAGAATKGFMTSTTTVLIALLLLSTSGNAAESPTSDWQAEWQRVMATAKKEGKVVVSVPPGAELRKALKESFERRFGIELELVTGRGSTIVKKIADEHRAGVQFFDVHTGGSGAIIYGLAGIGESGAWQFFLHG